MLITPEGFSPRSADDDPPDAGYWFVVNSGKLLVTRGEAPCLPPSDLLPVMPAAAGADSCAIHYFGDYDGRPCRVMVVNDIATFAAADADNFEWRGLRSLFGILPD